MNDQIKILAVFTFMLFLAVITPVQAVVIGDWEDSSADGWIDWSNMESIDSATNMPSKYQYDTIGATRGSSSLHVIQSGWGQSLAVQLNEEQRAAFMANSVFSIDVSVAANDGTITGGYTQVYSVYMNGDGPGFTTVASGTPINFYWWEGSGQRTLTLEIDYTDFRDALVSNDYIEIIFALNTGGGAPADIYFDNAQLSGMGTYDQEVLADSPVLYLRFETDEPVSSASGNAPEEDSSGNGYWAVHRASSDFSESAGIGNCRYLLNDPQNAIAAANQTSDPGWNNKFSDEYAFASDDITFEFWMKSDAMDIYGMFFQQIKTDQQKAPGMGNSEGTIRILNGVTSSDPNEQGWWYTGVTTPLDNEWHHMVVTYDENYNSDPNSMQIQFYLDGNLMGDEVTADTDGVGLGPELDHIVFGGLNDKGYTWNRYYGFIDEIAIYEGILSSERVATHYLAGMIAVTPTTCEEVWEKGLGMAGDVDKDCDVDLSDFAIISSDWMLCNDPNQFGTDPGCQASW